MFAKTSRVKWAVGVITLLGLAAGVQALVVAPPQGPARFIGIDTIVVGRVVGLENRDLDVPLYPGTEQKTKVRIAIVKVNETVKGAKGKDTIRVAFRAPQAPQVNPGGGIVISSGGGRGVTLKEGQDGLFSLQKHFKEDFYLPPAFFQFTSSEAATFAKEKEDAKKLVQLLANPKAGLTSKNGADRLLTVAILLNEYRRPLPGRKETKSEPIDAEESKLILRALAEADWNSNPGRGGQMHPYGLFSQLGVSAADGYQQPKQVKNINDVYRSAQDWVTKNQDTYRIKRLVPANP